MMGHTHVLSGAVVWLAAAPALAETGWPGTTHLSTGQLLAGTVVAAGAGLLPDIDHPEGRIAQTLGPITHALCKVVSRLSGGHRHGTHSLLFTAVVSVGMGLLAVHAPYVWWAALFVLIGFGLRGLGVDFKRHEPWSSILDIVAAATATALMALFVDMRFAGWAVAIGCLAHLLGDCLTPRGCPLLWPIRARIDLPIVPRTNGTVERRVVVPVLVIAAVTLGIWTAGHGLWTEHPLHV